MINILILGGSGILSTDVLKECLSRKIKVTCITRGTRDYRIPKGVNIIHGNVYDLDTVITQLDNKYDAILDFLSFDVAGLKYKLDKLSQYCSQYFFVSSATAYSFKDKIITERTELGNEYWDYGDNKVKCENFLRKNSAKYGIKYTIIRPYITYGKTRIPFGIIPVSGEYWTLANRIIHNKPVLLWDDGVALCTLTNTVDFAKGFVDLIKNEKAYNEAFHITSNEVLTWKEVLNSVCKNLNKSAIVFSESTEKIVDILQEYKGVLIGDKARDRVFDNSKIMDAAPNFHDFIPFEIGIADTINHYINNPIERTMNYRWDGRIDWAIEQLASKKGCDISQYNLRYVSCDAKATFISKIQYLQGRKPMFGALCDKINWCIALPKRGIKYVHKRLNRMLKNSEKSNDDFGLHKIGKNCTVLNCDFGLDRKMISIGNNVYISDGVRFINYRPSAQHYNKVFENGDNQKLRDLGPIKVCDNVFISSNVTLMPNVTIGENSLILEESAIFADVPPNSVVCGNPAKVVCNISEWYENIKNRNNEYPWLDKSYDHDRIVREREEYFFED